MPWVICQTKPSREQWAALNIRRQGAIPYLPQTFNPRSHRREALFPSYIFVGLTRDQSFGFLNNTYGISRLLMQTTATGLAPVTVSRSIIKELRQRENANGVISLKSDEPQTPEFQPNDPVKILEGPFTGHAALFHHQAKRRVQVLLQLLGQIVTVELERRQIVAAI